MDLTLDIKNKIEKLLNAGGIPAEVSVSPTNETAFSVFLSINDEAGQFIGRGGENLDAIEHLIRLVVNKNATEPARIFIDINGYKERRASILREKARTIADEVRLRGTTESLEPMSSFERRIIHLELAGRGDIVTESVGEEPYRKVIIKPA